jgi:hypothetical protein
MERFSGGEVIPGSAGMKGGRERERERERERVMLLNSRRWLVWVR